MERDLVIRQIILITDGQSNIGGDPIEIAGKAYRNGIIVNTIGIVEQNTSKRDVLDKIEDIARAGGGNYEYSSIEQLLRTMQGLIYKTVNQTLRNLVSQGLKEMIGEDINNIEPVSRDKLLDYIDGFSDDVGIRSCILLDSSRGMQNKIHIAEHSILDLIHSFKGRRGKVDFAVVASFGEGSKSYRVLHSFKDSTDRLERGLYDTSSKGGTLTSSAIEEAIRLINRCNIDKFEYS